MLAGLVCVCVHVVVLNVALLLWMFWSMVGRSHAALSKLKNAHTFKTLIFCTFALWCSPERAALLPGAQNDRAPAPSATNGGPGGDAHPE